MLAPQPLPMRYITLLSGLGFLYITYLIIKHFRREECVQFFALCIWCMRVLCLMYNIAPYSSIQGIRALVLHEHCKSKGNFSLANQFNALYTVKSVENVFGSSRRLVCKHSYYSTRTLAYRECTIQLQ